jgi:hypothetical protein
MVALCAPRRRETPLRALMTKRCTRLDGSRFYALSAFNVASDVYLFAVPAFAVWSLQMRTRRKVAVCALFVVGLLYVGSYFGPGFLFLPSPLCLCSPYHFDYPHTLLSSVIPPLLVLLYRPVLACLQKLFGQLPHAHLNADLSFWKAGVLSAHWRFDLA